MLDPAILVGEMVDGRYRLASVAGTGSYGTVYAADEIAFGEVIGQVALKLLRPPDDATRDAIVHEVKALAQLTHANLLAFRSAGVVSDGLASGCIYIATELAEHSLEDGLKQPQRMNEDEVMAVGRHLASALVYLARSGAVHRDVKPANILRVGDLWKLADFGLTRGFAGSRMQASGRKGTVLYMSPEAMQGETGPFVDVWALGVVLQECLTGRLPYSGGSDAELIAAALTREPAIDLNLPEPVATIVRGCLTKERHRRWTAERVLEALVPRTVGASLHANSGVPTPVSPATPTVVRPVVVQPAVAIGPAPPAPPLPAPPAPRQPDSLAPGARARPAVPERTAAPMPASNAGARAGAIGALCRWLYGGLPRSTDTGPRRISAFGREMPAALDTALALGGVVCGAGAIASIVLGLHRAIGAMLVGGAWLSAYVLVLDVWDMPPHQIPALRRLRAALVSVLGAILGIVAALMGTGLLRT